MEQFNNRKGFTLIELLVTIAVLGLLVGGILVYLDIGSIFGKASLTKAKKFAAGLERGELFLAQVGKWSFEEGVAVQVKDTSGYGNNGLLQKGIWKTADQCDLGFGGCLSFNGTDTRVNFGSTPLLNITERPITMSAWIKTNTVSGVHGIISRGLPGEGYGISLSNDKIVLGHVSPITSATAIKADKWYHILGIINGADSKIYINGALDDASGNVPLPSTLNRSFLIGAECKAPLCFVTGDVQNFFDGLIDEVQIYKEALKTSQIQHFYAQGLIKREVAFR